MTVNERISELRGLMSKKNIDAFIVPSFDAHQSEYVPEHWKARQWISGFTGSAGTVVVVTPSLFFCASSNRISCLISQILNG